MVLGILFIIFAGIIFIKLIGFLFSAVFTVGKLIFSIAFWPIILLLLFFGVFKFVLPVLIIIGVIILVVGIAKKASGSNRYDQQDYYSDYDRDSYQGPNQEYFQDQPQDYWCNKF